MKLRSKTIQHYMLHSIAQQDQVMITLPLSHGCTHSCDKSMHTSHHITYDQVSHMLLVDDVAPEYGGGMTG